MIQQSVSYLDEDLPLSAYQNQAVPLSGDFPISKWVAKKVHHINFFLKLQIHYQ